MRAFAGIPVLPEATFVGALSALLRHSSGRDVAGRRRLAGADEEWTLALLRAPGGNLYDPAISAASPPATANAAVASVSEH
jgi:hypothetical protein